MLKIVGKFLLELKTMLDDKNVVCEITDDALDLLVENGLIIRWVQDLCIGILIKKLNVH